MSEILRRTVFIDQSDGFVRFHDWALVTMQGATYMEPFMFPGAKWNPNTKDGYVNYDATDAQCRIDEIKGFSLDKSNLMYGDGCIGGRLMPRAGR